MKENDKPDQEKAVAATLISPVVARDEIIDTIANYHIGFSDTSIEHEYRNRVEPLLHSLFEDETQTKVLDRVFKHWAETRLGGYSHPLGRTARDIAAFIDAEYMCFSDSVYGDEIDVSTNDRWLIFHLILNVYGDKLEYFRDLSGEDGDKWIKILGNGFKSETPEELENARKKLHKELDYLRAYNQQYSDFMITHWEELLPSAQINPMPGSARREAFNAVLATGYSFNAWYRSELSKLQTEYCGENSSAVSERLALEKMWIGEYTRLTRPEHIVVYEAETIPMAPGT